ncbi:methylated-DNA--[protein]-cysteine S-methyltransferase [Lutibaculum baratangense]|uniref:Methylated-DNA-protein-cysteine methyltransferase n=1 Tax=Lutibaculum baratangense AMV1 TaxID=631454 RepID=V4RV38_9HYPH|nr:methylated-DNA--[protein]-cysteine S-methyltransferase [Lutibaculum baratangense]ESR26885.1 methylated-DNA-protein-cysteine methyltransferase [Lutibaculum baratangense AMV1]
MDGIRFTPFATSIGTCAVAWRGERLVAVQLPERDEDETVRRIRRRHPGAAPGEPGPMGQAAIGGIVALLAGEARDLGSIDLDMDHLPEFDRCVYEVARRIPPGTTMTYGAVAQRCGRAVAAQAVGRSLGRNPFPIIVPCHRVLAAGGRIGGFSANGGIDTKRRILAIESAHAMGPPTLFDCLTS